MSKIKLPEIREYLETVKGFDKNLRKLQIKHYDNGKCIAELKLDEEHMNGMGYLHGSLSATLVDSVSSFALLSHEGSGKQNVSVEMNMRYMRGATKGDIILIEANVLTVGSTLAFLDVSIKNKDSGELLVKGSHTMYMTHKYRQ
ncbi:hypothetical protein JTB14_009043 [Gonioctena quinquepunctata]|nr:hypothetical protein JTB14_009043 [Gonioctena quinquepunctata]